MSIYNKLKSLLATIYYIVSFSFLKKANRVAARYLVIYSTWIITIVSIFMHVDKEPVMSGVLLIVSTISYCPLVCLTFGMAGEDDEDSQIYQDVQNLQMTDWMITECALCKKAYTEGEVVRLIAPCKHSVHFECWSKFLLTNKTDILPLLEAGKYIECCPSCNIPVEEKKIIVIRNGPKTFEGGSCCEFKKCCYRFQFARIEVQDASSVQ